MKEETLQVKCLEVANKNEEISTNSSEVLALIFCIFSFNLSFSPLFFAETHH